MGNCLQKEQSSSRRYWQNTQVKHDHNNSGWKAPIITNEQVSIFQDKDLLRIQFSFVCFVLDSWHGKQAGFSNVSTTSSQNLPGAMSPNGCRLRSARPAPTAPCPRPPLRARPPGTPTAPGRGDTAAQHCAGSATGGLERSKFLQVFFTNWEGDPSERGQTKKMGCY